MITLEKEHFEHWLQIQPDYRVWDYSRHECCAGASFVRETTNIKGARFGGYQWRESRHHDETHKIPKWMFDLLELTKKVAKSPIFTALQLKTAYRELFPETETHQEPVTINQHTISILTRQNHDGT